jgi:hypothetical protein
MGTYAPAGVALFVASTLALVLIIAPVRSHVRARRKRRVEDGESLSHDRRARLEQF